MLGNGQELDSDRTYLFVAGFSDTILCLNVVILKKRKFANIFLGFILISGEKHLL